MNNLSDKKSGISLIIFIVLLVFTMVMHPAGGSVEHIIRISRLIIITHTIAIVSIPFGWIGFQGLTRRIGTDQFGSVLALALMSLGMIAVLLAAATNGLVLPLFLQDYKDAGTANISAILDYSLAVNHAFDFIYTGAFCLAIGCWSINILLNRDLPAWIGWLGVATVIGAAIAFTSGLAVNSLNGFRIFVAALVVWMLAAAIMLLKPAKTTIKTQSPPPSR